MEHNKLQGGVCSDRHFREIINENNEDVKITTMSSPHKLAENLNSTFKISGQTVTTNENEKHESGDEPVEATSTVNFVDENGDPITVIISQDTEEGEDIATDVTTYDFTGVEGESEIFVADTGDGNYQVNLFTVVYGTDSTVTMVPVEEEEEEPIEVESDSTVRYLKFPSLVLEINDNNVVNVDDESIGFEGVSKDFIIEIHRTTLSVSLYHKNIDGSYNGESHVFEFQYDSQNNNYHYNEGDDADFEELANSIVDLGGDTEYTATYDGFNGVPFKLYYVTEAPNE